MPRDSQLPHILWAGAVIFGLYVFFTGFPNFRLLLPRMGGSLSLDLLTADVRTLQALLHDGRITSSALVEAYLTQIEKHDGHLHAMIETTPRDLLFTTADWLDGERKAEKLRGPLHGIPITIKARQPWSHTRKPLTRALIINRTT